MTATAFQHYLTEFVDHPLLSERIVNVLLALPEEIQRDFLDDPQFRITIDNCEPGRGRTVLMPDLGPNGSSRCVVLKPRLEKCPDDFACYIIAHEFAHAYLRNGGCGQFSDREDAADALSTRWGFAPVKNTMWGQWVW